MLHEIFISYSRRNPGICGQVQRIVGGLGYSVFVDASESGLRGGIPWNQQLLDALDQVRYMVVLVTQEACANPKFIRKEIKYAKKRGVQIIPVQFDRGAVLGLFGNDELQYITAPRDGDACADPERLENKLRLAMMHRMEERLKDLRDEAREWAKQLRQPIFFREDTWRGIFPKWESVALIGPSGRGKSVVAARYLDNALRDPDLHAVVLRSADVEAGVAELARDLDARDPEQLLVRLEDLQQRTGLGVLFVVDGIDQIDSADDPNRSGARELLTLLTRAGQTVVTCQKMVWESTYAGRVPIIPVEIAELDRTVAADLLSTEAAQNPLLTTPFFLDLALRRRQRWGRFPHQDVDFLRRVFGDVEGLGGRAAPESLGGLMCLVLHALADEQLRHLTYDVPKSVLEARFEQVPPGYLHGAIRSLKEEGLLVVRPGSRLTKNDTDTYRLAHDLLDSFSMAVAVRRHADVAEAVREVCRRCELESGWPVLAMLVRIAGHRREEQLLGLVFTEMLRILDRKRLGDVYMDRAWAVTYVLNEQLPILMPFVLEALTGERIPSLVADQPSPASTLHPVPLLTAEAASSVAAAFLGLDAGNPADAPRVVPVLEACLHRWELRGRFIDALVRYDTEEVRRILVDFGSGVLKSRNDLPCLRYVARGVQRLSPHPSIEELLGRIASDADVDPVTRRRAHEGRRRYYGEVEPERNDAEVVYGLQIDDEYGRYSDWDVVREYALYVRDQVVTGRTFSAEVCEALVKALEHVMTFAWQPVAIALGCFNEPIARKALFEQLLKEALPAEVRAACVDALRRQQTFLDKPADLQAFRLLLLHTARILEHRKIRRAARDLTELALTRAEWLADAHALEVTPYFPVGAQVRIRTTLTDGPAVSAEILAAVERLGDVDTGPDLETKFRFTGLTVARDRKTLDVALTPTTWTESKKFHTLLSDDPAQVNNTVAPVPLGERVLPGIAVVHAIVVTSDQQVLFARRSAKVGYAPLHWSAGFEEQLNHDDVGTDLDPFTHAAQRGYVEEFGSEITPDRITFLCSVIELDILNLGLVMVLHPNQTAVQVRHAWRTRASDRWEAESLGWVPLDKLQAGIPKRFQPPHPTSQLRCAALVRSLFSDTV
ncbi:TIR domain-containing protein [Nocardia vinacea]|uniref:TIR domain-containing protein n=1 Tax=Nocardia vinacea TaxID=96468 RepID=UPI0033C09233